MHPQWRGQGVTDVGSPSDALYERDGGSLLWGAPQTPLIRGEVSFLCGAPQTPPMSGMGGGHCCGEPLRHPAKEGVVTTVVITPWPCPQRGDCNGQPHRRPLLRNVWGFPCCGQPPKHPFLPQKVGYWGSLSVSSPTAGTGDVITVGSLSVPVPPQSEGAQALVTGVPCPRRLLLSPQVCPVSPFQTLQGRAGRALGTDGAERILWVKIDIWCSASRHLPC